MTITIDCRMIDASGVGAYLRGILPFFLSSKNNFLLLGNKSSLDCYSQYQNTETFECNIKPFSLKEILFFPPELQKKINKTDIFFSPFFNIPARIKIPVFPVIHDMVFLDKPEFYSKTGLFIRRWFLIRAYKKSKKIFTVSEFSKSRIKYHHGNKKNIIVTYSAILPMFLKYRETLQNIQKEQTIIFTGNIKKNKGLDCLLDAFIHVKTQGLRYKLIIIGEKENLRSADSCALKKMESLEADDFCFTGYLSDENLMKCLCEASLLVQPSLYEGFGLPPLEAMVLGTRVLISDIPVFKEIYTDYPVTFFRCGDSSDLKEKMLKLLMEETSFIGLSDELLFKYSFEKTASAILRELQ